MSVRDLAQLLTKKMCVCMCVCVCVCVCVQFTNMAAGRITQAGGPRVDTPGLGGRGRRSEQINRLI